MTDFATMSQADRDALMKKIGAVCKESGLEGIKVKMSRETVCPLAAEAVEDSISLSVERTFGPDMKDQVDAFKAKCNEAIGGAKNVKMEVKVQLGPGSKYDTIKGVVPYKGGDPVDLVHKQGEVWFIDFWATWCPPCQGPMAHNQSMLEKRAADWGDKLKIIGISIDQSREPLEKHIDAKGWTAPIHYHRDKSDCSNQYNVSGVPSTMLVDANGVIVFKGHPANRPNLEQDFDDLLAGKKITGAGTEAAGGGDDDSSTGGGKALDVPTVMGEIDSFKTAAAEMQKDEALKEHAKKMPRCFCVMVFENTYDPYKDTNSGDFKNYRVLVGPQASIDAVKTACSEKVKGSFEVVLREHAV